MISKITEEKNTVNFNKSTINILVKLDSLYMLIRSHYICDNWLCQHTYLFILKRNYA